MKQIVDKSQIVIPQGTMEDFKRPNHPDFMTTNELKAASFSGQRTNSLTSNWELWVLGEVVAHVTPSQVAIDPQIINKTVAFHFGLDDVQPDMAELKRFRGVA